MASVAKCMSARQLLLGLLSIPLLLSPVLAAEKPVLRWCLDHFPGMHEFHNNNRMPVGPSVEMMQELARLADFTLQIGSKTPTSRCLKQLADGEIDVMVNLLHSSERAKTFNLVRFASRHPDRLYMAQSNPMQIQKLHQLHRLSLVTVRNFGLHPVIQNVVAAIPAQQKQQVDSTLIALQMIAKGRADGTLLPPTMVQLLLSQHAELATQIREVEFRDNNIQPQEIYLGFSRKITDPVFLPRIELALQQMKQSGTMRRLFGDKVLE
jgi:ABC-type amino acid transport substrate-binding protein